MQQNSRLERQTRLIEERAPLSLSAKQIQSKLQSGHADPFSAMQEYLKRGEADPDVVRVCLPCGGQGEDVQSPTCSPHR